MASVNKVILIGNLGTDPEIRYLPSGDAVANLSIATTEKYKDRNGEAQEATEWHRVSFFGKIAEICGQYLKKGVQVYVEGSIRTRKWQDKDGNDRYSTEIRGERMQMLGGRGHGAGDSGSAQSPRHGNSGGGGAAMRQPDASGNFDDIEDDIPFASCAAGHDVIGRRLERRMGRRA